MCGIVGLHLKNSRLEPDLGELLVPMVDALTVRGPDSAGYALSRDDAPAGSFEVLAAVARRRLVVGGARSSTRRPTRGRRRDPAAGGRCGARHGGGRASVPRHARGRGARRGSVWLRATSMEIYKDVGHPLEISRSVRFAQQRPVTRGSAIPAWRPVGDHDGAFPSVRSRRGPCRCARRLVLRSRQRAAGPDRAGAALTPTTTPKSAPGSSPTPCSGALIWRWR